MTAPLRLTDRKREAIVAAAIAEFRANGFEVTSMDKIAATAGVSKRTVYNHFPSKEELFAEILHQLWASSVAQLDVSYASDRPLREQLRGLLEAQNLDHAVTFVIDQRGLTVGLIGWETFFQPNSIDLQGQALSVVDTIGPILAASQRAVSVEGHADYRGSPNPFPTDWELSGGRATQVLRRMVETAGFPSANISAVGYGSARPARTGESVEDMAFNRRVDVAVLSALPEGVRELIPGALEQLNAPPAVAGEGEAGTDAAVDGSPVEEGSTEKAEKAPSEKKPTEKKPAEKAQAEKPPASDH